MRSLIPAVVLLCALAGPAAAQRGPNPPDLSVPLVVTAGEGVVRRAPDRALVTLAVESRATGPQQAQARTADAMTAVLQRIGSAGVPRDAVRTLGLSLEQEFDTVDGRRVPRGFAARNALEIRVDDLARLGAIVDAAVQAGATSVGNIRFDLKDRAAAEHEAVRLAVADARSRADAAAAGAGMTIARVVRIEEEPAAGAPRPMAMSAARGGDFVTPVEPGEIEIRAHVTLTAAAR